MDYRNSEDRFIAEYAFYDRRKYPMLEKCASSSRSYIEKLTAEQAIAFDSCESGEIMDAETPANGGLPS